MTYRRNFQPGRGISLATIVLWLSLVALLVAVGATRSSAQTRYNSCVDCHKELTGEMGEIFQQWQESVHSKNEVACHECHGGDPDNIEIEAMATDDFVGQPEPRDIPALCARCHADADRMRKFNLRIDQFALYKRSQHGDLLFNKGDERVATCASCHGAHNILKKTNPKSSVFHTKLPETCAKCHSDKEYMEPYNIPVDQFDDYRQSYHAQILYGEIEGKNPTLVPNCANCHGTHSFSPPGVTDVPDICGNCHSNTMRHFKAGPHYDALSDTGAPRCVDCHGNHKILFPEVNMFSGIEEGHCGSCHDEDSVGYQRSQQLLQLLQEANEAVNEVTAALKEIENEGRNVKDIEDLLDEARTNFTEALPVAHSLSVDLVNEKTDKAVTNSTQAREKILAFKDELKKRLRNLLLISAVIGVNIILLVAKRLSL